jgi:hypothetical protein
LDGIVHPDVANLRRLRPYYAPRAALLPMTKIGRCDNVRPGSDRFSVCNTRLDNKLRI